VCNRWPHDPNAFTEGLAFHDGTLYESTGAPRNGTVSTLRQVEISTGRVLRSKELQPQYFAEGLTILGGKLFQLTFTSHIGFVYDLETFNLLETFCYEDEGWGLTDNGQDLIKSNGSDQLYFINPDNFQQSRPPINVCCIDDIAVTGLNELEYIDGSIYANVFGLDYIVRINPQDGTVLSQIDLSALRPPGIIDPESVLNGIAYDKNSGHLFVTGKNWPTLFEIRLIGE
jgi:glutamine cyclotransferase